MIVRILSEGQFELADADISSLDNLDQQLFAAIDGNDEAKFNKVLSELTSLVRAKGTPVGADRFVPSDLTLPHEGATLAEVRQLLTSEDAGES
jgi:hypothetical protein